MNKIKKKPILIFIIAIVALYLIIYIFPKVSGALVSSYTVEYGQLKIQDETTGYFVRNEKVYFAGNGGKTNYYIKEGTMVRNGTAVLEVTGGSDKEVAAKYNDIISRLSAAAITTSDYTVQESGIVSFFTDGYESQITPEKMLKGDYEYYSKRTNDDVEELDRGSVASGEPVYKVVDRTLWYIVCFVDVANIDRYEEGDSLTVEFEDGTIDATVYKVDKQDDKARIVLSTNNYYDKFAQLRCADLSLVTSDQSGLLIQNSSIGEEKKVKGVYVKNKAGDYIFTPIKIISTDGENSVIAMTSYYDDEGNFVETVETYDDIIKNAK